MKIPTYIVADIIGFVYRAVLIHKEWNMFQPVTNVIEEISPNDIQYKVSQNPSHYFGAGQSAVQCIKLVMLTAGKQTFTNILDLPCGHGRVLRTLKAAFPDARLTACDLDHDAVDFCARVFGATPVYSKDTPDQIRIESKFDLIWVGSLLTHLNTNDWIGFLNLFEALLSSGGILVFTTHGRYVVERLRSGQFTYGLTKNLIDSVLESYHRDGFGYEDYPSQRNYGISLSSPSWVCSHLEKIPTLQILNYIEKGWNRHQDVIACVRV